MPNINRESQWQQLTSTFAQRLGLKPTEQAEHYTLSEANGTVWTVYIPQNGELIYLSCALSLPITEEAMRLVLQLNHDLTLMRGTWLSLDPHNTLTLNAQTPVRYTDAQILENILLNIMQIKDTLQARLSTTLDQMQHTADWSTSLPV